MPRKKTTGSAPCGIAMSDCTDAACAEYATCQKRVSASAAPCGLAMSDCSDACDKYATCQKRVSASIGACGVAVSDCAEVACCETGTCQQAMAFTLNWGLRQPALAEELNWVGAVSMAACGIAMSDCTDAACAEYATCQKKATASVAACGLAMSECTDACAEYATCQKKTTGRFITRKKLLSFGDSAEARPCTEGDDDSEYGPRGDDQKCVDEGGGYGDDDPSGDDYDGGYYDESPDCTTPGCDLEEGHGGTCVTPESTEEARDRNRQRSADEGDDTVEEQGYPGQFPDDDEPAGDVPEGYQEVGDPSLDPEDGDWESLFDEDLGQEMDLKRTLKEEEAVDKQEKTTQDKVSKEQSRTAISIPRDSTLDSNAYHQFWDPSHTGHSGVDEQRNFTLQKSVQILEERVSNPRSPEDAEAARSILMNGPKAGGTYQKTRKAEPGEPAAEDFIDREDRSPIV